MLKRVRSLLLPTLATCMLGFAVYHVSLGYQTPPKLPPPAEPARNPYGRTIAGSGIIEAQTENISVGSQLPGVVVKVHVKVGQEVQVGTPLFSLDDRQLKAELALKTAARDLALAQLQKLEQMPRKEETPAFEARVREAEAMVAEQEDLLARARSIYPRVTTAEEMTRREQQCRATKEQLARAKADFALHKEGAWEPDKAIARATLAQAEAQLRQTEIDLDRLTVRALEAGQVMQVNVRPGEFVGTPPGQPLILLGNLTKLHVRVDIDEHDIPRFQPGGKAVAMLRGHPDWQFPLTFVRVEPFVIPKKSLTGENTERVDTRVLQVIFRIDETKRTLYAGQQVDVFIDAQPATQSTASAKAAS